MRIRRALLAVASAGAVLALGAPAAAAAPGAPNWPGWQEFTTRATCEQGKNVYRAIGYRDVPATASPPAGFVMTPCLTFVSGAPRPHFYYSHP